MSNGGWGYKGWVIMASVSLKIVSVNIERHKHIELVQAFLQREDAAVVCLMEVCEADVSSLAGGRYPYTVYMASDWLPRFGEGEGTTGVAILAKEPIESYTEYDCGSGERVEEAMTTHVPTVIMAQIGGDQIGAIHFSWTADGHENARQERHLNKLIEYLRERGEFVLCGDFNIPRGYKLYQKLAGIYRDNIPSSVTTTIDPKLHRANMTVPGKLALMVDYIWSTPKYRVGEVSVVSGVSDHCGLVCEVNMMI